MENIPSISEIQESETNKIQYDEIFNIKSINTLDINTAFVAIRLVGSDTVSNVKVRVSEEEGGWRIQNEQSFPVKKMSRNETFEVELVRKKFINRNWVKISIEWDDFYGHQRDIKIVDIKRNIEIKIGKSGLHNYHWFCGDGQ